MPWQLGCRFDALAAVRAVEVGSVKVAVVTTAVGVVVTVVVGSLLRSLQRAARRHFSAWQATRRDRCHADHTTIGTGWWNCGDLVGASCELLVCVRAAPSKMLPAPVRLDVHRIARFVPSAFGETFPTAPEYVDPTDMVRYRTKDAGHPGADHSALVRSSGLIEATVPIARSEGDSGELLVSLVAIARALLPVIRSIQHGGYEQLLGPAAAIPLGLDWDIRLSRELLGQPSTPWAGLVSQAVSPTVEPPANGRRGRIHPSAATTSDAWQPPQSRQTS